MSSRRRPSEAPITAASTRSATASGGSAPQLPRSSVSWARPKTSRRRRRTSVTPSVYRNSAQAENGTRFVSLDEISAIVSATPRLVPIVCAI